MKTRSMDVLGGSLVLAWALVGCGALEEAGVIERDDDSVQGVEIPAGDYCERVADWNSGWVAFEDEVLRLVNVGRARGGTCSGMNGSTPVNEFFPPSGALANNGSLRCAARNHSLDMAANSYFAHNNPVTNEGAGARIDRTGYSWSLVAENIAVGQSSPQQVVSSWMGSFGHCTNILEPSYVELGVGFYDAGEPYEGNIPGLFWTQNFGTPR